MNQSDIKSVVVYGASGMVRSNILYLAPKKMMIHAPRRAKLDRHSSS